MRAFNLIPADERAPRRARGAPEPTRIVVATAGAGGGALVAQLFVARAVDALYLTLIPRILGGARAPTLAGAPGFAPDQIPDPKLASMERVGDELYLRYDFAWG